MAAAAFLVVWWSVATLLLLLVLVLVLMLMLVLVLVMKIQMAESSLPFTAIKTIHAISGGDCNAFDDVKRAYKRRGWLLHDVAQINQYKTAF